MTTRRRHYILCTYGEEQQSEFMSRACETCDEIIVPPLSLQIVVGQVSLHRHIDSKLVTIFIILYSEKAFFTGQTST